MNTRIPAPAQVMAAASAACFMLAAACSPEVETEATLPVEATYEQPEEAEAVDSDSAMIGIDDPAVEGGEMNAEPVRGADRSETPIGYEGAEPGQPITEAGAPPRERATN